MPDEKKEQFTKEEEIKVELTAPLEQPVVLLSTKRRTPIRRYNAVPLSEDHGMTTEANRFKES